MLPCCVSASEGEADTAWTRMFSVRCGEILGFVFSDRMKYAQITAKAKVFPSKWPSFGVFF